MANCFEAESIAMQPIIRDGRVADLSGCCIAAHWEGLPQLRPYKDSTNRGSTLTGYEGIAIQRAWTCT